MTDHCVLPFASWDALTNFYREKARMMDDQFASARFFRCTEGQWTEVARPEFAN